MSCSFPVGVHRRDGSATVRPCGTCINCRLDYSCQWAIRCYHEAQMHEENSFITLTYNDENLPLDGSIRKGEVIKFMKRLRNEISPIKVRFFGSGEYGKKPITGTLYRPHYHICLFGFGFPDKEILKAEQRRKRNVDILYISKLLGKVWQKGFHTIGEVNFKTAGYVARYITKKHFGKWSDYMYDGLEPEFALMSRGQKKDGLGGIGKPWFEKYWNDCYPKDYVTVNGRKYRVPQFYDSLLMRKNKEMYNMIKGRRENKAFKDNKHDSSIRQMQREKYRLNVSKALERKIEHGEDTHLCDI